MMRTLFISLGLLVFACPLLAQSSFNPVEAARHGWSSEQDRSPEWFLAQNAKLNRAINH